jgi:hypothetical protein
LKSEKDKERYRRWRLENPDKVREQRKRRWARKIGVLPPYEKPAPLTEEEVHARHIQRMKDHHQRRKDRMAADTEYASRIREQELARHRRRYEQLKADPVAYQAKLEAERNRRRLLRGNRLTDEQRAERKAEKERLKAERAAARPPKMTPEERKARRREWQKEYDKKKRDLARARRAAEVAEAMSRYPSILDPLKVCADPPELQALFKKASKGERPFERFTGKKMGAFTARAKWI